MSKQRISQERCKLPAVAVDAVIEEDSRILLIVRKNEPFKGKYALPGGLVEYGETCEQAVVREVEEETGLKVAVKGLPGVYSDPSRDPRGHTIGICYMAEMMGGELRAGSDASYAHFFSIEDVRRMELAFDHSRIVEDYLKRKGKTHI